MCLFNWIKNNVLPVFTCLLLSALLTAAGSVSTEELGNRLSATGIPDRVAAADMEDCIPKDPAGKLTLSFSFCISGSLTLEIAGWFLSAWGNSDVKPISGRDVALSDMPPFKIKNLPLTLCTYITKIMFCTCYTFKSKLQHL